MSTEIQKYEGVLNAVQKEESLTEAFLKIKDKLFIFAPPEIQEWKEDKKDMFVKKTMMTIAHDEKLKPCFDTPEGKMSLLNAVTKSCSTGLEIGGKHAYLIPQKNNGKTEARFSIKASGYFALLCGGDRPIFDDLRWSLVYAKDDCKTNAGTGEVDHAECNKEDRGDLVGCWVQIVKKNGQKEIIYYPMKKINQWKAFSKAPNGAWKAWPDEMAEQACIRHACDKYEQARDLLVASIYDGKEINPEKSTVEKLDEALSEEEITLGSDPPPKEATEKDEYFGD
jgi:phage RecT family recombinase